MVSPKGTKRPVQMRRSLGVRVLTKRQQDLVDRKKTQTKRAFEDIFSVYVDAECIRRHLPIGFPIQSLTARFQRFLKTKFPKSQLLDGEITAVGDMGGIFGRRLPRTTHWADVKKYDVYPRQTACKICGDTIQAANFNLRPPVNFERVIDVSDCLLEELVLYYTQQFPCNVVLAVGDGDYTRLIAILHSWGINVFLVMPTGGNEDLKAKTGSARSFNLQEVVSTEINM